MLILAGRGVAGRTTAERVAGSLSATPRKWKYAVHERSFFLVCSPYLKYKFEKFTGASR